MHLEMVHGATMESLECACLECVCQATLRLCVYDNRVICVYSRAHRHVVAANVCIHDYSTSWVTQMLQTGTRLLT